MEFNCDETIEQLTEMELKALVAELRSRVKELRITITTPRTDCAFLSKFLRTKNYKLDSALDSISRYYANVARNMSFIRGIQPSDFTPAFDASVISMLKGRSNGARVGIASVRRWNPKQIDMKQLQLTTIFLVEEIIQEVGTQESGFIVIVDLSGLNWEHITGTGVRDLKRILVTMQEGLPLKVAGLHFLNTPLIFWTIYQVMTRFLKDKLRKRIHFNENANSLHQHIDPKILPRSVGGHLDEDEAFDRTLAPRILKRNIPYEDYWNGCRQRRHGRRRPTIES